MMRSTDECEMSRSCHSATSSSAACRLPRSTRASPDSCSDFTGLRLCGIALEPFCSPSRNGSSTSRTSVRCRCRISSANDSIVAPTDAHAYMHFGVAVAGEHLRRRDRLRARGARTRTRSTRGIDVRIRADRARELADRDHRRGAGASRSRSRRTCIAHSASLAPKVVGSAWMPCVRPTIGVSRNSRARVAIASSSARRRREDHVEGAGHLQRERGVDDVARREAVVDPAARGRADASPARRRRTRRRRGR